MADSLCGWSMWNSDTRLTASWSLKPKDNSDWWDLTQCKNQVQLPLWTDTLAQQSKLTVLSSACPLWVHPPCERWAGTTPYLQNVWWSAAARICRACPGFHRWLRVSRQDEAWIWSQLQTDVTDTEHNTLTVKCTEREPDTEPAWNCYGFTDCKCQYSCQVTRGKVSVVLHWCIQRSPAQTGPDTCSIHPHDGPGRTPSDREKTHINVISLLTLKYVFKPFLATHMWPQLIEPPPLPQWPQPFSEENIIECVWKHFPVLVRC